MKKESKMIHRQLRLHRLSLIDEIQQDTLGRIRIKSLALGDLGADTAAPLRRVRLVDGSDVRHIDAGVEHVRVEEVVDDVHAAVGRGVPRSVERAAGEARVGHVEGGLEEVGELVEDVRELGHVGAVVEEEDEARSG